MKTQLTNHGDRLSHEKEHAWGEPTTEQALASFQAVRSPDFLR